MLMKVQRTHAIAHGASHAHKKKNGWTNFLGGFFPEKTQKCLESPEMAKKLIGQFFNFFGLTPSQTFPRKMSASVDRGLSEGSSVPRPGNEGPHRR
jgi:hypothetical protein